MSRRQHEDEVQAARRVVDIATGERPKVDPKVRKRQQKNGRLGGLKGGKARAKSLTPERRAEIAREAAQKRWGIKRDLK